MPLATAAVPSPRPILSLITAAALLVGGVLVASRTTPAPSPRVGPQPAAIQTPRFAQPPPPATGACVELHADLAHETDYDRLCGSDGCPR